MADNIPQLKSYNQYLGDMLSGYMSRTGVNDLNVGSLVTSFFEVVALTTARAAGDAIQILKDTSVDRATGESLQRIAIDENVPILSARVSSGTVTIVDTSFTKISTKIYSGTNPPNIGSTTLYLSDAESFPATGQVYLGRGTPNAEGPISYSSAPVQIGSYWALSLDSATTKYHNINESVVLAQGGLRTITVGTLVTAPAFGTSPSINFSVTTQSVILDGETTVSNVQVSATEIGSQGNVPAGAIKSFVASPYPGLTVTNGLPYTTGRDTETDDQLRTRIKRARLSRNYGTVLAVKNSVIGATAPDENATVVSDELQTVNGVTTLYIDDGTGYEEKRAGVGIENIIDSAFGGEKNFQLECGGNQTSVAKAYLESNLTAPFDVVGGDSLAASVGGIETQHTFSDSDFQSPGSATAYELAASINGNAFLNFEATTSGGGTRIVISAKAESNDSIETTDVSSGRNVAALVGFPSNLAETLKLYKNKQPLSKDGAFAFIESETQVNWGVITTGATLKIAIDGTPQATYTFTDADFIAEGTYLTVSESNSLASWANVINAKIPGITATVVGDFIELTSNKGISSKASIVIDPTSTLVVSDMFSIARGLESYGKNSDYTLSRNTAQITLNTPLVAGDSLTAGTQYTEGQIESSVIVGGSLTLSGSPQIWFVIDDVNAKVVKNLLSANTQVDVTKQGSNTLRFTSAVSGVFANVIVGNYVIIWSSEFSATNRLEARVSATDGTYFEVVVTAAEYAAAVVESAIYQKGIVFIKTNNVPQKFIVGTGTLPLSTIAASLNDQTPSLEFSVQDSDLFSVKTVTKNTSGAVLCATFNADATSLGFTEGAIGISTDSLVAFYESGTKDGDFPAFFHETFSAGQYADPPNSYITSETSSSSLAAYDPNYTMGFLEPYGSSDMLSPNESVAIDDISGTALTIDEDVFVKRLRVNDRFYLAEPLAFTQNDKIVAVLDSDDTNKTFAMPLYRRAITNTTDPNNANNFNAYDVDGGTPTTSFLTYFTLGTGVYFNFKNFKALMQAKNVLDPSGTQNAILFRSVQWGRSGEKINVGYVYPSAANSNVYSSITIDDNVNIQIILASGAPVTTSIDGTTQWNVTITPNTPTAGVDQVTYTWSGVGTAPLLSLAGGEYVTIGANTGFDPANTGSYRVSTEAGFAPTSTSFTIVQPTGVAVAETATTLVNGGIIFALSGNTTANDVVTYVTSNLSNIISATIVNDGGTGGTGQIQKSTYEDSDFAYSSLFLQDGINWIASSDIANTPQFTFKRALNLFSATGYAFNNGEEVRLVPTTIDQVVRFENILAVSGITSSGTVHLTEDGKKMEIATDTLGAQGAVQIVGGFGNSAAATVEGSSATIENAYISTNVGYSALQGFISDQIVKLTALNKQKKATLIQGTETVTIVANSPSAGKSTITFGTPSLLGNYFGNPRINERSRGRTFKIEKQGLLTCMSWNGVGTSPYFSRAAELNDSAGGDVDVIVIGSEAQYAITSGNVNFSELSIGGLLTVSNFPDAGNNGTFLITGISLNGKTIQVSNPNAVATTGYTFTSGDFSATIQLEEGDTISLKKKSDGTSIFASLNEGTYRIIRRFNNSIYFYNENSIAETVTIPNDFVYSGVIGTTYDVVVTNSKLVLTYVSGTSPDFSAVVVGDELNLGAGYNVNNQGSWTIVDVDNTAKTITAINPKAVAETGIAGTTVTVNHSAIVAWDYDATVADDTFTIANNFLGSANRGTYTISQVLNQYSAVVNSVLSAQSLVSLSNQVDNLYVTEATPYDGYKKVRFAVANPANQALGTFVFEGRLHADKINASAGVSISPVSKLAFNTVIKKGIDSYQYDTGLIAECNRIVYGDPRDTITYKGVAAAGAEIFIKPPLNRRIQVSIDVRVNTGVPFSQVVERVRTSVAALINSNPVGAPIAISAIVSAVNSIPGVRAVAISSPLYNASNDVIQINPNEKARILSLVDDVLVSQIS